jgi:DNA invertase Pin-like site-specific DNA recombinase
MIAAIYARKSTEQNGVSEEEKSVTRQIDHAKQYAAKKGWTVIDEHVYVDDGVSGAEFLKRPGFVRLMNTIKGKPTFQVLIMSEESRLGRGRIETEHSLKRIVDAGVRVFYYLSNREARLSDATSSFVESVRLYAAEMEREKASERTYDAMLRKAKYGHVLGGRVYGYDNISVMTNECDQDAQPKRSHVERRINPKEAVVVRRIFQLYGSGTGLTTLAKTLNQEHVLPPGRGRHGWAPSAIREMLHRELYRGISIWNQTQSVQIGGTKKQRQRPESEWLRTEVPHLRIVFDEEWQKVQDRLKECATIYRRANDGTLRNGPCGGVLKSQYVLSGLAKCGICGKSIVGITTRRKGHVYKKYGCACYQKRGAVICRNNLQIGQSEMDRAVLASLRNALEPQLFEEAVQLAIAQIENDKTTQPGKREFLNQELSEIDKRIERLAEAIAATGGSETIYEKLRVEEGRRTAIRDQLSTLTEIRRATSLDSSRLVLDLRARINDLRGLLTRQVSEARSILKTVLNGSLTLQPIEVGGKAGYRFYGTGSYGSLMTYSCASNDGRNGCPPPIFDHIECPTSSL